MEFKFANIMMLTLVWAVPALTLVYIHGGRKRRRILSGFAGKKAGESLTGKVSFSPRRMKAALILFALLMTAVAISGPLYGYRWQEIHRKGVDIIIALDCSRSMLAGDIRPTRLDRAKREVYDLLGMLKGDRVGLVAFSGEAFLQCPLTMDYEAFNIFLDALSPDFIPVGGTAISKAIQAAVDGFGEDTPTEKAVILITDGESTDGDPLKAAKKALDGNIKIFTIGVGGREGIPVPDKDGGFKKDADGKIVMTRMDETLLKKVASLTGGTYARSVAGDMDLDAIYTGEIRGKMEQTGIEGGRKKVWEDRYQWFVALAVFALLFDLFIPGVKRVYPFVAAALLLISVPGISNAANVSKSMEAGQAAFQRGEYESALSSFIEAQLEAPENPRIYYNLGCAYYKLEDYKAAGENFARALASKNDALKQRSHYNLGNTNFRDGKYEDALKSYEDALEIDPDDGDSVKNLEFVKKVIEQRKEQPPQKGNGDKKENEEGKDENKEENGKDEKSQEQNREQDRNDKQGDDKRNDGNGNDKQEDRKPGEQSENEEKSPGESQKSAGKQEVPEPIPSEEEQKPVSAAAPGDKGEGDKQSAKMLNRLEDKPGSAMMPRYGKQRILKDW